MDNTANLTKVLDGLKGAEDILDNMLTPEILEAMTTAQRIEIADARKGINNKDLQEASRKLEKFTKTI
tara:strand:+ start:1302 stop:1505 length:204 start_codon:yes stop_codon:yes gene_type:complete